MQLPAPETAHCYLVLRESSVGDIFVVSLRHVPADSALLEFGRCVELVPGELISSFGYFAFGGGVFSEAYKFVNALQLRLEDIFLVPRYHVVEAPEVRVPGRIE